jgi:hypothetical protein
VVYNEELDGETTMTEDELVDWIVRNIFPAGVIPAFNFDGGLDKDGKPKKKSMAGRPSDGGEYMARLVLGHLRGMHSDLAFSVSGNGTGSVDVIGIGAYHGGSRADCTVFTFGLDYDGPDGVKALQTATERAKSASLDMAWLLKNDGSHRWHAHGIWKEPQNDVRAKLYLEKVFSGITPLETFPKVDEYTPSNVGNQLRLGFSDWCPYFPMHDLEDIVPSEIPSDFICSAISSEDKSCVRAVGAIAPDLIKSAPSHPLPPHVHSNGSFKLVLSQSDLKFYGLSEDSRSPDGASNQKQILLWINYGLSYDELCSVLDQNVPLMAKPTKDNYDRRLARFNFNPKFPWGWKRNQTIKKLDNHWLLKGLNPIWSPRKGIGLKSLVIYRAFMDYLNPYGAVGTDEWGPATQVPMKYVIDPARLEKVDWKLNRIRLCLMGFLSVSKEHQYEFGLGSNHARWYQVRLPSEHNAKALTERAEVVHMNTQSSKSREPKRITEFMEEMDAKYPIITIDRITN